MAQFVRMRVKLKHQTDMAKIKVKPLADRVLVEPAPAETKTSGGIIIPDTAKEKPMRGKIIAVGSGKPDEPMTGKGRRYGSLW
jgi:chaperonin GroES